MRRRDTHRAQSNGRWRAKRASFLASTAMFSVLLVLATVPLDTAPAWTDSVAHRLLQLAGASSATAEAGGTTLPERCERTAAPDTRIVGETSGAPALGLSGSSSAPSSTPSFATSQRQPRASRAPPEHVL